MNNYIGDVAFRYEQERASKPGWALEHLAVAAMIGRGPVLDVPCGTGRFFPIYKQQGLRFLGIDNSADMLKIARERFSDARLKEGDALDLELPDMSFGTAVCIRFLPWLNQDQMQTCLSELSRVAATVVVSVRLGDEDKRCWRGSVTHSEVQFRLACALAGLHQTDFQETARTEAGRFLIVQLQH